MQTVFSHIVHKRLSMENEDVATEALNFIIYSSDAARTGLMKLLRGVASELPELWFQTQQVEEHFRPDMRGMDGNEIRVFIENKFWAGLTDNQPLLYLNSLAECNQQTVLLFVVPEARQEPLWREILHRVSAENIPVFDQSPTSNLYRIIRTEVGPFLAITSWHKFLSAIEVELADEPKSRNDLLQLRSLCDAADSDAFIPLSAEDLTNQRYPQLILQLNSVVEKAIEQGVTKEFLNTQGLRPMASWEQIGRYISFPKAQNTFVWLGTHFKFWGKYGRTPLWLLFWAEKFGHNYRAYAVQTILTPWADQNGIFTSMEDNCFIVGIDLVTGEELKNVIKAVAKRLSEISEQLSVLRK